MQRSFIGLVAKKIMTIYVIEMGIEIKMLVNSILLEKNIILY